MTMQKNNTSVLLIASALGVIGLVISQVIWINHSWQLSEAIFNQRVSLALCASIQAYDGGALCEGGRCTAMDTQGTVLMDNLTELPVDLIDKAAFREEFDKSLRFNQINLDYTLSLSKVKSECSKDVYQTAVSLPMAGGQQAYLRIVFPNKKGFLLKNMGFMVVSTILILIAITLILLFVNWSLVKQKRLLQTNVDFFNHMAHEFRTPLSNIGLAINRLTRKHPELKGNQFVDVIRHENTQLLGEVERVLHLANVENGDYALQKEVIGLKTLLQSAINSLTMPIAERKAQVYLDAIPDDAQILGDRQHLGNVFRNILDNALKYTTAQPHIEISAKPQAKGIVVAIQDNGIGIPQTQYEMIFEKFQRVHRGNEYAQKGFGLGLAYVKHMIELHKGSVHVSSEENKGSRFEVFLPTIA
ncbi:MAG: HAMP domain-containing histidine kinase [Saprospiraceae bacterium]|nr:HAMP domain-containing histidine kinase [Saprospiraceae bacterium]